MESKWKYSITSAFTFHSINAPMNAYNASHAYDSKSIWNSNILFSKTGIFVIWMFG